MKNFYQEHGLSKSHLYSLWNQLKNRCVRTTHPLYEKYGAKGVQMHPEWENDFLSFYDWAKSMGYEEGHYIVRTEEAGHYTPGNCFISERPEKRIREKKTITPIERYYTNKHLNPEETRLKNIWRSMRERCSKVKSKDYRFYGAKGITVCEEWNNNFDSFKNWAFRNGYDNRLILGREDTTKEFSPENCHWTTIQKQNRDRNSNIRINMDGQSKTLYDLSDEFGINPTTIRGRLERGLDGQDLTKPLGTIEIDGRTMSFKEAELLTGIPSSTLTGRYYRGKTNESDLLKPSRSFNRYDEINIDGRVYSLKEWSTISGIQYPTLLNRYKKGLRGKDLLQKKHTKEKKDHSSD